MPSRSIYSTYRHKTLANEENDSTLNINCLPEDVFVHIFSYLTQNELAQISRVCKKWNRYTRCPVLWKKIDVVFHRYKRSQDDVIVNFSGKIPTCATHIKLNFQNLSYWRKPLNFEDFCVRLQKICLQLRVLIFHCIKLSVSIRSAIELCSKFLPTVKVLAFRYSEIIGYNKKRECEDFCLSNIQVLDLYKCVYIRDFHELVFPNMPHLKKLNLAHSTADDYWFQGDITFMSQLEVFNASGTLVKSRTFELLKNHALNITELYLCDAVLKDSHLDLNDLEISQLKIICLRRCFSVTVQGIVSLVRKCQYLHTVYVNRDVAVSYAIHPFIAGNRCKLQIVKIIAICSHFEEDYFHY